MMEEQQESVEEVRARIGERYPMYIANPGFEQWLLRRAVTDLGMIEEYLTLLDDYGYITGDGTIANDYQNLPDPRHVVEDIRRRLAALTPGARGLLRRAAVQGPRFSLDLVMAADDRSGHAGPIAGDVAGEAIAAGVIAPDEHPDARLPSLSHRYRFVPLQAAKILYEELPEEERARYHTALVEFLGAELGRVAEPGAQDMLAQMISEHNKRFARPDPSPSKD